MYWRTVRALLPVGAAACLLSCGGGGGGAANPPPPPPPPPPASGLDARPNNTACVAPDRGAGNSTLSVVRVFPSLAGFSSPVALLQAPGDSSRWFVVQQGGRIRVFENLPTVTTAPDFLNLATRVHFSGEAGLLGLAFHPDFPADPRAFVNYTRNNGGQLQSVTSEFTSPDQGGTLDPNSERILLVVNKSASNHNGGQLAFDGDGYLRIGLGDGGGANDPENNAQNPMRLLGKMLRIDVDTQPGGQPYGIPADNPFAGNNRCNANGSGAQNCPEIFALGLRNPWRWSFDRQTGQQWVGDVGQGTREEIDVIVRGANYGWDIREGFVCAGGGTNCASTGFTDPVADYGRNLGASITGGYVYRGSQQTELVGRYLFADFVTGMIASLAPAAGGGFTVTQHVPPGGTPPGAPGPLSIPAFGESNAGELFLLDYGSGLIYRLVFTAPPGGNNVPQLLSQTGCLNTSAAGAPPLLSLIPYRPNAQFWSDGAAKERWIGLPNGMNIAVQGDGDWQPPRGTVLVKHFRLNNVLVETRLFMRHPDDVWAGYTYEWNAQQTEATRVTGGKTVTIGNQDYVFPSEGQCIQCHTQAAGSALGLETAQLNGNLLYPQTGRTANQITTLNAVNVLSPPVAANPPAYADPSDAGSGLAARARSYLHTNCANCHRPNGPTGVNLDLRHDTPLSQTGACDVAPSAGNLGIANARIIAPGDDARSVLLARMARRGDAFQMPPLSSTVRDTAGEQLIGSWIDSLTAASCQ
jgi:uncharacterized repeat protein (TIGR03806 family)